eukprot:TRINITY_DN3479_c0_g1_i5.p1 TRINITY_DN3479_c0_g1~~TRINITY_DN3479_c0_g1_i5.p1  ORF type:complete len:1573 (+),score=432.49 TRINITY_DN3479_c0_g1_i5:735-5453(+)
MLQGAQELLLIYLPQYFRQFSGEQTINQVLFLFEELIKRVPELSSTLPLAELGRVVGPLDDEKLDQRLKELENVRDHNEKQVKRAARTAVQQDEAVDDSFKQLAALPAENELGVKRTLVGLPKNDVERPWRSGLHYLRAHALLLREEMLGDILNGIASYRAGLHEEHDLPLYFNVRARKVTVLRSGAIAFQISFQTNRKKMNWNTSKRLTIGSLLCLTPDQADVKETFKTCIFATVADRELEDLNKGILVIDFCREEDFEKFDASKRYLMVESPVYFLSLEPFYRGLLRMDPQNIPFSNVILDGADDPQPPQYLRVNALLDFSPIYENLKAALDRVKYDVLGKWPQDFFGTLKVIPDKSQLEAIRHIMTNKFSLVQGPPGTGKSFIGVKAVQMMLSNPTVRILVVCLTNHALDQFLLPLLPHCPELVRMGGRSKTEDVALQSRMIGKLRVERLPYEGWEIGTRKDEIREIVTSLAEYWSQYSETANSKLKFPKEMWNQFAFIPDSNVHDWKVKSDVGYKIWLEGGEENYVKKQREAELARRVKNNKFSLLKAENGKDDVYRDPNDDEVDEGDEEFEEDDEHDEERGKLFAELKDQFEVDGGADWTLVESRADQKRRTTAASTGKIRQDEEAMRRQYSQYDDETAHRIMMIKAQVASERERLIDPKNGGYLDPENEPEKWPEYIESLGINRAQEVKEGKQEYGEENEISEDDEAALEDEYDPNAELKYILEQGVYDKGEIDIDQLNNLLNNMNIDETAEDTGEMLQSLLQPVIDAGVWSIPKARRNDLIKRAQQQLLAETKPKFSKDFKRLKQLIQEIKDVQDVALARFLQSVRIVGMTANQAAMKQNVLSQLNATVVFIEEAAELLESQILACVTPQTQQLILIGDHKQLRPKVSNYELEKNYNFAISMFERLLNLGIPHQTLEQQVRMRPEIADIMRFFYPNLKDHPRVKMYPPIPGIATNVYFVCHQHLEDTGTDGHDKKNTYEAEYIGKLAGYLIKQGIKPDEITVITPYRSQKRILKKADGLADCIVSTVDDYQGDENRVVLLSLVRSNKKKSIGFVKIVNRIIVSLSRAREGLYMIGNKNFLTSLSNEWFQVVKHLEKKKCCGEVLTLQCQKHPNTKTEIRKPDDFNKVKHGGCTQPCNYQLPCGHTCPQMCHPSGHENYLCSKPCAKLLPCGHMCKGRCGKQCPPCSELVDRTIIPCGHNIRLECSDQNLVCSKSCDKTLPCGHRCPKLCGQTCGGCSAKLNNVGACGHQIKYRCGTAPVCEVKCTKTLDCDHVCPGNCSKCSKGHQTCTKPCKKPLICGHECKKTCSQECSCERPCSRVCSHTSCRNSCGELCQQCVEPCDWRCKHHKCTQSCYQVCDRPVCNKRCTKKLECNHRCNGLCGEECPPCKICDYKKMKDQLEIMGELDKADLLYKLPDCGHVFPVFTFLDKHMIKKSETNGHAHVGVKACPECKKPIYRASRYNNLIKAQLVHVENVKKKIQEKKFDAVKARKEAVGAMGSAQGHWFYCPNGHPYYIGECGGAMQVGTCPDCKAQVGGTSHTLLPSNSHAGDLDGSSAPSWPTMLNR